MEKLFYLLRAALGVVMAVAYVVGMLFATAYWESGSPVPEFLGGETVGGVFITLVLLGMLPVFLALVSLQEANKEREGDDWFFWAMVFLIGAYYPVVNTSPAMQPFLTTPFDLSNPYTGMLTFVSGGGAAILGGAAYLPLRYLGWRARIRREWEAEHASRRFARS